MSEQLATSRGVILIRPAIPADAAPLRDLRLDALANDPVAFAADYGLTQAEPAEAWVKRIGDNLKDDNGVICVAVADGRMIGMTGLGRGHWPKTEHSGIIWGVYVDQEWRGLGVADALLNECIGWGQAHGVTVVKLGVTTGNTPAIRCYVRCGFTVYGLEPQAIYYENVFYDELLMARTILDAALLGQVPGQP